MRWPTREAVIVVVVVLGGCLAAAVLFGTRVAAWCAAGCVLAVAATALSRLGHAPTVHVRARARERAEPKHGYPRYDRLCATLSWGLRDPRYFERMLRPLLLDIALDLRNGTDPARTQDVRAALGERHAWLFDPGPGAGGSAHRTPDQRELTALLSRLEELERTWT